MVMKNIIYKFILACELSLVLLVSLADISTFAQEVRQITMNDAINIALENNFDLRRSANSLMSSEISYKQEKADFYPNLSASVSPSQRYGQVFDQITGQLESQQSRSMSVGTSVSINVFNGFNDIATLQKAQFELNASESSFDRTQQDIIYNTVSQFLQITLDKELILIDTENLEAQRQQLKRIEEFYKAGNRPIADVLQQRAAISQVEFQLLNTERNAEVNKLKLLLTMGILPDLEYQYITPSMEDFPIENVDYNEGQLIEKALAERSDLGAQRMQIKASDKQITAAKSGYWPTISLFTNVQSSYSSRSGFPFSEQIIDVNPNTSFGFSVSIPIFDRYRTKSNVENAKIQLSNNQLSMENLEQQTVLEVRQGILDFQSMYKQLGVAEAQFEYAEQALEAAEERYNVGASTLVELSQARASYVEAAGNQIQAKINLLIQRILIAYYTGNIEQEVAVLFE